MNGIMNGISPHPESNGTLEKGSWTIGLINSKYKYLTAETFGFKVNANGTSLKKKQMWTLESFNDDGFVCLRSHLDKYVAVDQFWNVTCDSPDKDLSAKFEIIVGADMSGRWALRNVVRGYFLGAAEDKLICEAKVPGDRELWYVHLAARPQVNIKSVGRKRFAHLSESKDEIHVDANVPWGEDTLFTLNFRDDRYAICASNTKYLTSNGKLADQCSKDCLFSLEFHHGNLALRDGKGYYLSPIGSKATLKTRSQVVTKDELFSLEESLPQAGFMSCMNDRYVSVKQGVDVTANQDEISDFETFQLEFDSSTKRWYIRTMQDKYWTLETSGGIQASNVKKSSNSLFELEWQQEGSVALRANNGKYVTTKKSGHLYANAEPLADNSKFYFYLINRPLLVLKCDQGFVGMKNSNSPKLECNKATYDSMNVEKGERGQVYFKGSNGMYWRVSGDGIYSDASSPEGFFIELIEPSRITLKTVQGSYVVAEKNGNFGVGDGNLDQATKWEY